MAEVSHHPHDLKREEITLRFARIAGHAASLKRFWEEGRECQEILNQIAAVRAALDQVGRVVLEEEIACQTQRALQLGDADEAIRTMTRALHYFH